MYRYFFINFINAEEIIKKEGKTVGRGRFH